MPYGSGQSKASHYKPLKYNDQTRVNEAKRRARREKPLPLPSVDLGPARNAPDATRKLEPLNLATSEPRRDRNW